MKRSTTPDRYRAPQDIVIIINGAMPGQPRSFGWTRHTDELLKQGRHVRCNGLLAGLSATYLSYEIAYTRLKYRVRTENTDGPT